MVILIIIFLEKFRTDFHSGFTDLHSRQQCMRSAFVVCFLGNGHADWGEVESQPSFDLHFLYG
jgi:hypothetical protein